MEPGLSEMAQALNKEAERRWGCKHKAQLTAMLAHLKAVLGNDDWDNESYRCAGCCGSNLSTNEGICPDDDCPRYQARQHLAELERG